MLSGGLKFLEFPCYYRMFLLTFLGSLAGRGGITEEERVRSIFLHLGWEEGFDSHHIFRGSRNTWYFYHGFKM